MFSDGQRPLPLCHEKWEQIATELHLSPTHKQIVELILKNRCDKQIESDTGMAHSTLRTHIDRIFQRLDVENRLDLVLLVFARSQDIRRHQ
jgi:DNA-binding NarL/FixJ family response regulator